jgi:hypothetical protein
LTGPTTTARFADIEVLLVGLLTGLAGGEQFCDTETPENLQDLPRFIRCRKIDGGRDHLYDRPIAEIHCFGPTRAVAQPLSEDVFEFLMRKPSPSPAIDVTYCSPAPRELPWPGARVRLWSANYAFDLRRTRIALL